MTDLDRRNFMLGSLAALASGLLVKRERVYSFASNLRVPGQAVAYVPRGISMSVGDQSITTVWEDELVDWVAGAYQVPRAMLVPRTMFVTPRMYQSMQESVNQWIGGRRG